MLPVPPATRGRLPADIVEADDFGKEFTLEVRAREERLRAEIEQ
jgi:hypothetical protein